jgi:hypothetical protein
MRSEFAADHEVTNAISTHCQAHEMSVISETTGIEKQRDASRLSVCGLR